jgi:hypothetical protein
MNAGTLMLYKWLSNNDRIRAAEMVCMNMWGLSFNTDSCMTVGTVVLFKWLIIMIG